MIGMLWFDPDPKKTLETKIAEAAAAYKAKFGRDPNACMVSQAAEGSAPLGIALERSKTIQPNHLLIGEKDGIQTSL